MSANPKKTHGTGVMNKLRDKMPHIIIFLILAFVATIVFEWGMNYLGIKGGQHIIFAEVDGHEITYQQYEQALQQQIEQMRQQNNGKDVDENTIEMLKEQVFNNLVQQTLTKKEMERLGLKVTDAEILDNIYNRPESLPEVIRKNFMDSTGVFNMEFYQQALGMKTKEATTFWNEVEKYMREVMLAEKLQNEITSSVIVSEAEILQKYNDENIKSNFNYAFLDLNTVTDTTVTAVTDAELKNYYDNHKDDFKQEAAVKFKYVMFSDSPTADDSASLKKLMEINLREMKEAKLEDSTLIKLVNENSSSPFNDAYQKPSAFGKVALNFLFGAKIDSISGVLIDNDAYKVIKLLGSKEGEDTYINASHILINFGSDTAAAKKKAEDILKRVRAGEDIEKLAAELSEDPSAKQNNGDLGWFTKGAMVKEFEEACMNASPGSIVGPVKTQYGFHIIKVKGKSKKEFKVAEIKKAVTAGQRTKDIARKKAQDFLSDVENGAIMDSLAKGMQLSVFSTPDVSEGGFVPGAGQNKNLINFGLENKKGKLYGPVKMQGGYGVYQIIQKTSAGYKEFDSIKVSLVKPKVVQEKKFEYLQKMALELRGRVQNGDVMTVQGLYSQFSFGNADSVSISKPDTRLGLDYPLYNAVMNMKPGTLSEPIKGSRGYYVINLNWITPFNEQDYASKREGLYKSLLSSKKQQAVQDWLTYLQNNAKIIDNRDRYL